MAGDGTIPTTWSSRNSRGARARTSEDRRVRLAGNDGTLSVDRTAADLQHLGVLTGAPMWLAAPVNH